MAQLERAGIVLRHMRGRLTYYQANPACPILPELQSIVTKTSGVVDVLREALTRLSSRILVAFVFGSFARGDERGASDIDLMIIGDVAFADIVDALAPAQETLKREINPVVYSQDEFGSMARDGHHFVTEVLREPKAFVIGEPNELGRLGPTRMVAAASANATRSTSATRKTPTRSSRKVAMRVLRRGPERNG